MPNENSVLPETTLNIFTGSTKQSSEIAKLNHSNVGTSKPPF